MSTASEAQANKQLTVALIGNPNTGKSTLFNALTGGKARIGNFPGVTVEKKVGHFQHGQQRVSLIDLPGTYSLSPRSADEMVSVDVLLGERDELDRPDAVVVIVDSSNLERNLYLFSQVRDIGLPTVLVLNMTDLAEKRGVHLDLDQLKERLQVPVVATSAHKHAGIEDVRKTIIETASQSTIGPQKLFPDAFYVEAEKLAGWLSEKGHEKPPFYIIERMLLDVRGEAENREHIAGLDDYLTEARARLAAEGCRIPMMETRVRYDWIRERLNGVVTRDATVSANSTSDRIDRVLTHRIWGLLFFVFLMFLVFQAIYAWSGPFMDMVESGQTFVSELVEDAMPSGTLRSLLVDGIIAGVGSVIIFVPQIAMLFLAIAIMEDCGYMSRAAFLMDKLMTRVGLSGKSFLPLMSSFACAIPGVMATRVIENRRDRMVTILVAPLMSCSARLPVYVLMVAAFVPQESFFGIGLQGMVLFGMHALGAVIAIPVAWILKKTFFKGETPPFVMELAPYKWPSARIVADRVWDRVKAFVMRAGSLIFCVTVLVWALGYFPGNHEPVNQLNAQISQLEEQGAEEDQLEELIVQRNQLSAQLIRNSYLGRMGQAVEPAVKPLGWDWRIGVGAIASFPAREVIIATMGTIFSLGGDVDEEDPGLKTMLKSATWPDGRKLFTVPVAFSIMVFFALCAQCGATLMVIRRETNSWRWPIFTFVYMTLLAYVAAFVTYQVGTAFTG